MKTISVGELKARFSEVLDAVRKGETVVVSYGRRREKVAAIVPYREARAQGKRTLGKLAGKARVRFARDFSITDEELLST
jgi:prevent-host-death family protein